MRLAPATLAFALASSYAVALVAPPPAQLQVTLGGGHGLSSHAVDGESSPESLPPRKIKVPGDNPVYYCDKPDNDILVIESVDVSPNPPHPGKPLTINAKGKLKKAVDKGAKVHVHVRYGLVTLLRQSLDLCEQIGNVDLQCPVGPADLSLSKSFDLPREIPPGKYIVDAEAVNPDGERITCLSATVEFHRRILDFL